MNKNILIINGSTRVDGNTDIIINKVLEGAADTDVHIEYVNLKHKQVADCIGCYKCLKESECSLTYY